MSLAIHFVGGPKAGEVLSFDDKVEKVTIGRDPDTCQVVFPPDETKVGREHCELRREAGHYRLVLNRNDVVLLDGKLAHDGQELPEQADLQLGRQGPKLVVRTTLKGTLAPTAGRENQRGQGTLLRDTQRAARRGWWLAAGAIVLIVGVAAATYQGWHKLEVWRVNVGPKIDELSNSQQELLKKVSKGMEKHTQTVAADEQRLRDVLNRALDSVYLVVNRDPTGDMFPEATAWVIDREKGILATNGHVADIFNEIAKDQPDHKLVVLSPDNPPRDFVVKSVDIHPGYSASTELWDKFKPVRRTAETASEAIDQPGPFCDVALLYVDGAEGLAEALPLADDKTFELLGPGYPAGLAGYPMEGLVLGGVNPKQPTPTVHLAYLSAVTNYFGAGRVDLAERLLVQHAIPTAGGASGSPILNADGHVIAIHSGGNSIGQTESGARIGSTAMINFGQRADLVRELLDGRAADAQAVRSQRWQEELAQYFRPAADVAHDIEEAEIAQREAKFNTMLDQWRTQLATDFVVANVSELAKTDGALTDAGAQSGSYQKSSTFNVPAAGKLLVAAVGHKVAALNLDLYRLAQGKRGGAFSSQKFQVDWLPYCFIEVDAATRFEAVASGTQQNADFTLHAWLAEVMPLTPETRRNALATAWINAHFLWKAMSYTASEVSHASGKLSGVQGGKLHGGIVPVTLPAADEYFVVADTPGGQHITLAVAGAGGATLAQDTTDTAWPSCSFSLSKPAEVQVSVFGPSDGVAFDVYVYRATPPSEGRQ